MPAEIQSEGLADKIRACRLCQDRFAQTKTMHTPNPVPWFAPKTPILVAGQAPGVRVHNSNIPFNDRSGDRLRDWMGMDRAAFYRRDLVSVLPTSFCFPGYNAKGADLPPPKICWDTWHATCLEFIGKPKLTLLVGAHAIWRHTGHKGNLTDLVQRQEFKHDGVYLTPHPSWRNNAWLKKNSWFENETLAEIRDIVRELLTEKP